MVEWRKKSSSFQGKEDPKKSLSSGKLRVGKFVCMGVTMYADTRAHRNNFTSNVYKIVFVCVCARVGKFKYIAPLHSAFFSVRRIFSSTTYRADGVL